jgi:hypothetical protein
MNRFTAKQDGIALVTALLLTLISLTIVMAVMYMITQNITQTGINKRYRTALEASYGGTDIIMKEMVPFILQHFNSASLETDLEGQFGGVVLEVNTTTVPDPLTGTTISCLQNKLDFSTAQWNAACNQDMAIKSTPDLRFELQATGSQAYTVYAKIIDTARGNTDMSGLSLEGSGVGGQNPVVTPQHLPNMYRLEIQAEKESNEFIAQSTGAVVEKGAMSVLYAY